MKRFLKTNPVTRQLYAFARAVYVLLYDVVVKFLKAWVRWRSKKQGFRVFTWNGHTIREEWETPYTAGRIINNLVEFNQMANMARRQCGPAPVIFDVGANIGLASIAFSEIEGAKVYGFEPVPSTFRYFEENVRVNNLNNITPLNIGLSDKKTSMSIGPPSITSDSGGYTVNADLDDPEIKRRSQKAHFDSLDNIVSDYGIERIDYIKVDIEGHEVSMLHGGVETIKRLRPVIQLEYHWKVQQMASHMPDEFISFVSEIGYDIFEFEVQAGTLTPIKPLDFPNYSEGLVTELLIRPAT